MCSSPYFVLRRKMKSSSMLEMNAIMPFNELSALIYASLDVDLNRAELLEAPSSIVGFR